MPEKNKIQINAVLIDPASQKEVRLSFVCDKGVKVDLHNQEEVKVFLEALLANMILVLSAVPFEKEAMKMVALKMWQIVFGLDRKIAKKICDYNPLALAELIEAAGEPDKREQRTDSDSKKENDPEKMN